MRTLEEREAIDDDAEEDENEGADDGVLRKLGARVALGNACMEGKDHGDADDEYECGEDQVGGGKTVPVGVMFFP